MKRLIVVALVALFATSAWAEIYNDPAGITVTDTSQTVLFPRAVGDILLSNDSGTDSVYVRVFWCGEATGAATTNSLEVKLGKSRAFTFRSGENNDRTQWGYCAVSLIGPAGGATVRLEAK